MKHINKSKRPTKESFYFFYFTKCLKLSELAIKYEVSEKTINIWRKELGIPKKGHRNVAHPRFNPPKEEIERLYTELKSSKKVGEHYGKDATTILYCLRRYGIPVQKQITTIGTSWNKGLTKNTSEKVRLLSEKGAKSRIGLLMGDKNPAKRPEVKAKIRDAMTQTWQNPERRKQFIESFKNRPEIWNKGKTGIYTTEQLKAMSDNRKGSYEQKYGKEKADRIKKILSEQRKGKLNPMWNNPVLARTTRKDTSIEIKLRRALLDRGHINFSTNKFLHGFVGDIVFGFEKLVIEADGCYWHGCKQCKPWKNIEINDTRIVGNIERGKRKDAVLEQNGWIVLRFWEHEINKDVKACVDKIELHLLRQRTKMEG